MSDSIGRYVSLAVPDLFEIGGRAAFNTGAPSTPASSSGPKKPRKPPGLPANPTATPSLGKQEILVTAQTNRTPDEIQAGLDATLIKFIDDQPTPEKKSEVLIKIGLYSNELSKYLPMIRDADEALAKQVLEEWFALGDGPLKKALVNSEAGAEEFPLVKSAPPDVGAEMELAKMLDAATGPRRMALAQNIGFYAAQLHDALDKMAAVKIADTDRDAAVAEWVAGGDGSHRDVKKHVAEIEIGRRLAKAMTEADVVDEHAGNAPSHVGARLGATADSRMGYAHNSAGEGAGPRLRGTTAAPNQAGGDSPNPGSGPNDTGDGGVNPAVSIRRAGSTGGLGSVAGAGDTSSGGVNGNPATDKDDVDPKTGKRRPKKPAMDKTSDLAVELVKIAPQPMMAALELLDPDDQVSALEISAQHAADLMAWSTQTAGRLQKAALDAAIVDWLKADPDTVQLKKWVAEALATAEEIPLGLAKAIMGWTAPASPATTAPATIRLRPRYATAA